MDGWLKGRMDRLKDALREGGSYSGGNSTNICCQQPLSPTAIFQAIVSLSWIIWGWISGSRARQGRAWLRSLHQPQGQVPVIHFLRLCLKSDFQPLQWWGICYLPRDISPHTSPCEICPDFPSLNSSLLNFTPLLTAISLWATGIKLVKLTFLLCFSTTSLFSPRFLDGLSVEWVSCKR